MKVLVTGSAGFIAGYFIEHLLDCGDEVVGVDNFSKYGPVVKSYQNHARFTQVVGDAKDVDLLRKLIDDCDQFVPMAAMVGGITYFHKLAYDLLAENERLTAAAFDAAIWAFKNRWLKKITVISSSMVFENAHVFPTPEGEQHRSPPPSSTYGFQKLACEYFARGALEQYALPYTIVRPFNCVGVGEQRARADIEVRSGNLVLGMSHVVPDLALKVLKGQDPLHILGAGNQVRHYTYGGDLAKGIRVCLEHPAAANQDFNLSIDVPTTVEELAKAVWRKVHGPAKPCRLICDDPFPYDVQVRSPEVSKAKELLGYVATTPLDAVLDEVIPWVRRQIDLGNI